MKRAQTAATLAAVGALVFAAAASASTVHVWAVKHASGDNATVAVAATIEPVTTPQFTITAPRRQKVNVTWDIACASTAGGFADSSKHGSFAYSTRKLNRTYFIQPTVSQPTDCFVDVSASLSTSGKIFVLIWTRS